MADLELRNIFEQIDNNFKEILTALFDRFKDLDQFVLKSCPDSRVSIEKAFLDELLCVLMSLKLAVEIWLLYE